MAPLESVFKSRVIRELKKLGIWHFTKEAMALRGLPDLIGCYQGRFFAWELKRSEAEANKKTGRIVLQRHILTLIRQAGGIGEIVYPENFDQCLADLLQHDRK